MEDMEDKKIRMLVNEYQQFFIQRAAAAEISPSDGLSALATAFLNLTAWIGEYLGYEDEEKSQFVLDVIAITRTQAVEQINEWKNAHASGKTNC